MFNLNFIIMKKLMLCAAALMIGAIGFAQNTSTVTQTGDLQVADVIQVGSNTAVVTQNQEGIPDNDPVYTNKAYVNQLGFYNNAVVSQHDEGTHNEGYNDTRLWQNGNYNDSYQVTISPDWNGGVEVNAWQTGNSNDVVQVIYSGYTDDFYIYQYGDRHKATQLGTDITHNTARIYQYDSDNTATQNLFGSNNGFYGGVYANERILIEQYGTWNNATQTFTGIGWSHGNTADIFQNGYNNYANQYGTGRDLYADFNQIGNSNSATSYQDGERLQVFINQTGNSNNAISTQIGIDNLVTINQNSL